LAWSGVSRESGLPLPELPQPARASAATRATTATAPRAARLIGESGFTLREYESGIKSALIPIGPSKFLDPGRARSGKPYLGCPP
jgi:hypothetical protein